MEHLLEDIFCSFQHLQKHFSEQVSVWVCVCASATPPPPIALSCHPTPGARGRGHGWSTMWELVPAGGVNRPPDGIKIYTTGRKTHKHTQECTHKHCTVVLKYAQRTWVSFSRFIHWYFLQNEGSFFLSLLLVPKKEWRRWAEEDR